MSIENEEQLRCVFAKRLLAASFIAIAASTAINARASSIDTLGNLSRTSEQIQVRGGLPTPRGLFLDAVVIDLKKKDETAAVCSGVVISPAVVLTAGHCLADGTVPVRVTATPDLALALDLAGKPYKQSPPVGGNPSIQSVGVARYESMNAKAMDAGFLQGQDLALLFLQAPFRVPVSPATIPELNNLSSAELVRVVGFGETGQMGFGTRLMADVPVAVPRCDPSASSGPETLCARGAELFAKRSDGKFDTCPGDSGGPVYIRNLGGAYYLVGITSRPPTPSAACGGGTFVTLLDGDRLKWIQNHANIPTPAVELRPEPPPQCTPQSYPPCM